MITPIRTMTISQIIARQDDLLISVDDVKAIAKNERTKAIEECKEVVRQHWINGTVAHRIAEEIYGDLEKLKEQKRNEGV